MAIHDNWNEQRLPCPCIHTMRWHIYSLWIHSDTFSADKYMSQTMLLPLLHRGVQRERGGGSRCWNAAAQYFSTRNVDAQAEFQIAKHLFHGTHGSIVLFLITVLLGFLGIISTPMELEMLPEPSVKDDLA